MCSSEKEEPELLLNGALLWFLPLVLHSAIKISSPTLQSCCAATAFGVGSAWLPLQPKASWPRSRNKTFYQNVSVEFSEKFSLEPVVPKLPVLGRKHSPTLSVTFAEAWGWCKGSPPLLYTCGVKRCKNVMFVTTVDCLVLTITFCRLNEEFHCLYLFLCA